jgi:hypothetical protein
MFFLKRASISKHFNLSAKKAPKPRSKSMWLEEPQLVEIAVRTLKNA